MDVVSIFAWRFIFLPVMPTVSKKCDVKFKIKNVEDTLSMYKKYMIVPCNDKKKGTEACLNIIVFLY